MRERIAFVDLDGTCTNSRPYFIAELLKLLGKQSSAEFLRRTHESLLHLDDEAVAKKLLAHLGAKKIFDCLAASDPDCWASRVTPYPGTGQAFRLLKKHGFRVYICTARNEPMRDITTTWLKRYGLAGFVDALYLKPERSQASPQYKAWLARDLEVSHVFEDSWDNTKAILKEAYAQQAYLINRPWNKEITASAQDVILLSYPNLYRQNSFYHAVLDAIGQKYEPRR